MKIIERIAFPKGGKLTLQNLPLEDGKPVRIMIVPESESSQGRNKGNLLRTALNINALFVNDETQDYDWEEVFRVSDR